MLTKPMEPLTTKNTHRKHIMYQTSTKTKNKTHEKQSTSKGLKKTEVLQKAIKNKPEVRQQATNK